MQFLSLFGLMTAGFVVVGALERVPAWQFRDAPLLRPFLGTDAMWYGVAGLASLISAYVFRPVLSQLTIGFLARRVDDLVWPAQLLLVVAIFDFIAFTVHITIHRFEPLWTVHKVHHSSLHLDWLATTRTHMFEHLVRNVPAQAVLFVLGFRAETIALAIVVYALFAVHGHSNLDINLRGIESVLITPRLHRIHHIPATTNANFGTVFSIWDRAFGRLLQHDTSPAADFGVPGERDTYPQQFWRAAREPLRQNLQRTNKRRQIDRRTDVREGLHDVNREGVRADALQEDSV